MKNKLLLFLLVVVPILELSIVPSSFSYPVNVWPDPPVTDPVLPTESDPFSKNSSDPNAYSPEAADVKVVHHQDLNKKILVALVVSSSLLGTILMALSFCSLYRLRKLKNSDAKGAQNSDAAKGVISFAPILDKFASFKSSGKKGLVAVIEHQLLVSATNNFDEGNVIGEGGSGCVYKARFNDRSHAAVKKVCAEGQEAERIFENEVEWLRRIKHQNVVSLLGYCIHGESQYLVYELMENGSLEFQLHGPSHGSKLTWHMRMKIALDVARGLEYLHERCNPPVIHRDLKSSNILLDSNFNAKLSDFGLAIAGGNYNEADVKLSGTVGYVAPEYLLDGKLTDKSDVYAFGVILLELLTGRKPVESMSEQQCQSIATWALPQLTDRTKLPTIVDPAVRNTMDLKHLYQVAAIGVLCVQPEPSYRPLITDVLHSFIPLVPIDHGGSLRVTDHATFTCA